MLGRRRRRRANIETTVGQYLVFVGMLFKQCGSNISSWISKGVSALYKMTDTPFHIQGDDIFHRGTRKQTVVNVTFLREQ